MGTWGHHPWENDSAADWFGEMFDRTKLAELVEETLRRDVEDSADEIRAAASVLLAFGHTFIWPIKKLDAHLTLAAGRLEALKESGVYAEAPEIQEALARAINDLRSRFKQRPKGIPGPPAKLNWWEFWK